MYLHRAAVKSLVLKHQSEFRGSELLCEVVLVKKLNYDETVRPLFPES
ncbi:hypothetical protein C5S35_09430 [Candidatus Methanophagaceae archaeon]|nr:hypothetical protein C5S35_09430 [Methanophagales archaeon]